ncbi:PspA/IM30 family protein [Desulfogranum japonicum]|uniref:PspA/IM30 family protein n=1 Tax=Desulfogranum japonicum TaxID=231447 RepID=UPI000425EF7B|nr:PspA/IM30 family protein [Desulfogranum japonicum]
MKNSITSRVGRIISGSFNALVDAVENAAPETVMEQAIREVDSAVDEVRTELSSTIANKHLANSRLLQINQKCEDLASKIEFAVEANRDDLAEAAIAQQLDYEAQIPVLENQISDLSGTEQELEGYIAALKGKKREMQEELNLFRESRKEAAREGTASSKGGNSVERKVDQAESAFDRVLSSATGRTGSGTTDAKTAAKLNELEDLSRKHRIQERLAAVKSKKG